MKQLGEILSVGDKITFKETIYEAIPTIESGYCNGCYLYKNKIPCKGIKCSDNDLILKLWVPPKYPVLLVAGESIEILGLELLIIPETDECYKCIFDCRVYNSLCKQVDCGTNKVIISEEVVE